MGDIRDQELNFETQEFQCESRVVVEWGKLPRPIQASHMAWALVWVRAASLQILLPDNVHGKAAEDGSNSGVPVPRGRFRWSSWLPAPGFDMHILGLYKCLGSEPKKKKKSVWGR